MKKNLRVGVSLMIQPELLKVFDRVCELERRSRADYIMLILQDSLPRQLDRLEEALRLATPPVRSPAPEEFRAVEPPPSSARPSGKSKRARAAGA